MKKRFFQARCSLLLLFTHWCVSPTLVAAVKTPQRISDHFKGQSDDSEGNVSIQGSNPNYGATFLKQTNSPQRSTARPESVDDVKYLKRDDCDEKSARGDRLNPGILGKFTDVKHDDHKDEAPGHRTSGTDQSPEAAFQNRRSSQPDQYPEPSAFAVRGIMADDYEQTSVKVVNTGHFRDVAEGSEYSDPVEEESNERHESRTQLHEPPTVGDEGPWEVLERRWRGEVRFQATAELLRKELIILLKTMDSYQQSWARVRRLTENDTFPVSSGNIAAAVELLRFSRSRAPELAGGLDAFVEVVPGIMESLANQQAANFKVDLTSVEQEQTDDAAKLVNLYGVGALKGLQGETFRMVAVAALKHGNFDAALECLLEAKGLLLQSLEEDGAGGGVETEEVDEGAIEGEPTSSEGPNEERRTGQRDLEKLDALLSSVVVIHNHALSINGLRFLQHSTTRQPYGSPTSRQNMTSVVKIPKEKKLVLITSSKSSSERGDTDPNTSPSNSRQRRDTNTVPSKSSHSKLPGPTDNQLPAAVGVEPLLGDRYLRRVAQRGGFPGRKYQEWMQTEALCRGHDIRDDVILSSLYCHYTSANTNPWLLIGPLRHEVISLDPLISVTYDVISSRERELIITQLKKQRFSIQATDGSILDKLTRRIEAATGLSFYSSETPFISQRVRPSGGVVSVSTTNAGTPAGTATLAHTLVVLAEATTGGRLVFPWVGAGIGPVSCTLRSSPPEKNSNEALSPAKSSSSPPSAKSKVNHQRPAINQASPDDTPPSTSLPVPGSAGDCEDARTLGAVITWYPLLPSQELDHVTSHTLCPVARGQKWFLSRAASYSDQWERVPCPINMAVKMTAMPIVL